ncbi:hypothetical protein RUND412_000782, partial [Rhizina undulata]
ELNNKGAGFQQKFAKDGSMAQGDDHRGVAKTKNTPMKATPLPSMFLNVLQYLEEAFPYLLESHSVNL